MNYQKIYHDLIERSKTRTLVGYFEKHHIQPRCMGGKDEDENFALLTPEEHYVAHQLLVKMFPNHDGLIFAAKIMTIGKNRSNKLYGWLKRRFKHALSGKKRSLETKKKISIAHLGKKQSIEITEKIAASNRKNEPIVKCVFCNMSFASNATRKRHIRDNRCKALSPTWNEP